MPGRDPLDLRHRLLTAFDLWNAGVALKRQSLRRTLPTATAAEIERLLNRWLAERPGAHAGDGPSPPLT